MYLVETRLVAYLELASGFNKAINSIAAIRTDHSVIPPHSHELEESKQSTGFWKMNNSL